MPFPQQSRQHQFITNIMGTKVETAPIETIFLSQANWSGAPLKLLVPPGDPNQVTMNQTTNGPMILTGFNLDRNLGNGTMRFRKGNAFPKDVPINASLKAPVVERFDFGGDSLTVQNQSLTTKSKIQVSSYGFGRLVNTRIDLNTKRKLRPGSAAQGNLPAGFYTLQVDSDLEYTVFGLLTPGASAFRIYAVGVVDSEAVPKDYDGQTSDKILRIPFSTNGGAVYLVNLSPVVSPSGSFIIF